MVIGTSDKHDEYVRHAEHCFEMAKLTLDQESRSTPREMAAEWLNAGGCPSR
jgi:hypothetical protein